MPKSWRLTRSAETSLTVIARWTVENFGPKQAAGYKEDLIARCAGIAAGTVPSQDCRRIISSELPEDLRFARCGQHFIVFVDNAEQVIIVDFLHARTNLPRRLAALAASKPVESH
ncbi:type II toxin-antitoxin system RelE/ParE family toxin (plasmid) [Sinorhizobium meliloti]|nr:type II toxin-antitoxin system RelE/ParE family toxin [Sinorhizobium meliloti]